MISFWPDTQLKKELEDQRARNEALRWLVETRQRLRGETPIWISYDEPESDQP